MDEKRVAGLFEGTSIRTVEMKLLEETYQQAMELAEANGWPAEEALLTIFAHGLAKLRGDQGIPHPVDEEALLRQFMRLDGMYSVMKYRAFRLTGDNQRMGMALAAYKQEYFGMRRLVDRLRRELEEAKRAVPSSPLHAVEPQAGLQPPMPATARDGTGVLRRLLALLPWQRP